jgi:hypothetical protein
MAHAGQHLPLVRSDDGEARFVFVGAGSGVVAAAVENARQTVRDDQRARNQHPTS